MTVYRICVEYGVADIRSRESRKSDSDVTRIVGEIRLDHPTLGETMVMGRLQCMCTFNQTHLPICHREFGTGTEYGRLES